MNHKILISALIGLVICGCSKKTTAAAVATSSTPMFDGKWVSACFSNAGSDYRGGDLVDNGKAYVVMLKYPSSDGSCSGSSTLLDGSTFSPITDPTQSTNVSDISLVSISGIPVNTYVVKSLNNKSQTGFSVAYFSDATTIDELTNASFTSFGSTWEEWLAGDSDIGGFMNNPTGFTATNASAPGASVVSIRFVDSF